MIVSYIKVVEEERESETKLIPSTNISNQPGADPLTSTSSLPITNELTHEDNTNNNIPSQPDEEIQNPKPIISKEKKKKKNKTESKSIRSRIQLMHCDIIKDEFWDARSGLLYM